MKRARLLSTLAICSLILLALLQYRWLGQVGEAQRQQLTRNLERDLERLSDVIDREVTRAYTFYIVGVFESLERESLLAERERLWREQAPYPRLVQAVYLIKPGGEAEPRRLGADGTFTSVPWTGELDPLRAALNRRYEPGPAGPRFLVIELPALVAPPANIFARRGPPGARLRNTIHPAPPDPSHAPRAPHAPREPHAPGEPHAPPHEAHDPPRPLQELPEPLPDALGALIVVVLDQRYLSEELLPQLLEEMLVLDPSLPPAYRLERLGSDPQLLAAGGGLERGDPQAQRSLLRLRQFSELGLLRRSQPSAAEAAWRASEYFPLVEQQARQLNQMVLETGTPGMWRLAVGFRGDKLEHVLFHTRLKNLLISLAILSLLALSLVLIQRSSARERDLAKRQLEFVAGISHELLTPLAGIRSAGQNLAAGVITDKTKVVTYGQVIEKECDRLTELVRQVLTYAGLSGRNGRGERAWLEIAEVVVEGLADCRQLIESHGFTCETQLAEDSGYVLADRLALRRVLQNLVGNAIKYAAAGAWLGVRLSRQGREVVLSVRDRGAGIDPADLDHLFEPFYRGHRQVAGTTPGSGLGLYIVKHIVAEHGGQVTVGTGPEGGAEFTVRLPALDRLPAEENQGS